MINRHLKMLSHHLRFEFSQNTSANRGEINWRWLNGESAQINPRDVKERINEINHSVIRISQILEILALLVGECAHLLPNQHLRIPIDGRERGAQLMGSE